MKPEAASDRVVVSPPMNLPAQADDEGATLMSAMTCRAIETSSRVAWEQAVCGDG